MTDVSKKLKEIQKTSTCLKRRTACLILKEGKVIAESSNKCNPPNGVCQRMNVRTGTNYDLCNSRHAERLCTEIMKEKGLFGGKAFILGHYYACDDCLKRLRKVGITKIKLLRED